MAIPREFINELLDRVDIVDLIGQRLPLKSRGQRHKALCPFHQEKTPSFTVDGQKQFFYCFGCRASGTAIDFLMRLDGGDFVSVVQQLAAQYGLEVPRATGAYDEVRRTRLHHLADILDLATQYYRQCLKESHHVGQYVAQRGISQEVVDEMRIGFAPAGNNNVMEHLTDKVSVREMLEVGLIKMSDQNQPYDAFRNRLMFPIRNNRGLTVGFGGRSMSQDNPAKYLNTAATHLFHKKTEIYGMYEALRHEQNSQRNLLLVEGYMDVVAMKSHGLHNAVACMGTAVDKLQLQYLLNKSAQLTLCFDGDNAGRSAAWRAVQVGLPLLDDKSKMNLVFLPDGDDPDSYLTRHGAEKMRDYLTHRTLELDKFIFQKLSKKKDYLQLSGQVAYAGQVIELCAGVRSDLYRNLLMTSLGKQAGISRQMLKQLVDKKAIAQKNKSEARRRSSTAQTAFSPRKIHRTPFDYLIELLVSYPRLLNGLEQDQLVLTLDTRGWLKMLLDGHQKKPSTKAHQILEEMKLAFNELKDKEPQAREAVVKSEEDFMKAALEGDLNRGKSQTEVEGDLNQGEDQTEIDKKFNELIDQLHEKVKTQRRQHALARIGRKHPDEIDDEDLALIRGSTQEPRRQGDPSDSSRSQS